MADTTEENPSNINDWIKHHRAMNVHPISNDSEYFRAWILVISAVNWKDKKWNTHGGVVDCPRGSAAFSIETWMTIFEDRPEKYRHWTESKVKTFFGYLVKHGMAVVKGSKGQYTTKITIVNYCKYQDKSTQESEEQPGKEAATVRTPVHQSKQLAALSDAELDELESSMSDAATDEPTPAPSTVLPLLDPPDSQYPYAALLNDYGKAPDNSAESIEAETLYNLLPEPIKREVQKHAKPYTDQIVAEWVRKKDPAIPDKHNYMKNFLRYVKEEGWTDPKLKIKNKKSVSANSPIDLSKCVEPTVAP